MLLIYVCVCVIRLLHVVFLFSSGIHRLFNGASATGDHWLLMVCPQYDTYRSVAL